MDRAHTLKRNLAILAGTAFLFSLAVSALFPPTAPSAYFEVGLKSAKPGFAELFYDLGRGMNAAESVSLPLRTGDSTVSYRFPLRAGNYYGLRFDPIDRGDCEMTIRDARLIDRFGHLLRDFEPADFVVENDISQVEVTPSELRVKLAETDT